MNNCPFCNSNKLKYYEEESGFYITCLGCDITAPTFKNPDKSIAAWNTRPIEAELRKDYANLKEQFQVTLQAHNDLEEELEQKEKIEAELRARVAELENQVFNLSAGTRNSRMAKELEALKQWQREAVRYLKGREFDLQKRIEQMWVDGDEDSEDYECLNMNHAILTNLIKQAGEN